MPSWAINSALDSTLLNMDDVFQAGLNNHHISNTAYPIAHTQTWKPYRVSRKEHHSLAESAYQQVDNLSLYSHIPFCETRCYFCEYTVVDKSELDLTEKYMSYMAKELRHYNQILGKRTLYGFDIGGGTPSFVDSKFISSHIKDVETYFDFSDDFEISIETTPKIASSEPQKVIDYKQMGIDRISMGIQVTQPDLLRALGREKNGLDHIERAAENIRSAGFSKFNIDIMYGFAKQSLESWEATLRYAIMLQPEYITLYRMRYKLTRISDQAKGVDLSQIHLQAKLAKEILFAAGYLANEGKNTYSRIKQDTGTSAYLTRRVIQGGSYIGLGLGAQSFSDTTISYNSGAVGKNLNPYFKAIGAGNFPIQDLYHLPKSQMMAKMIAVSLYFGEINLAYFQNKFGVNLETALPDSVFYAIQNGLMSYSQSENGHVFSTEENAVPCAFNN